MEGPPKIVGDREIVVNTGDCLHPLAIAMRQPLAIECFDLRRVGGSVFSHTNALVAGYFWRH